MSGFCLVILRGVTKSFSEGANKLTVLNNITVAFSQGKSYAIEGVSGTGKSTFIQIAAGFDRPDTGVVYYNGSDISKLSGKELDKLHNKEIGLVFQRPYLIKELSVIENIMLPGLIQGCRRQSCKERSRFLLNHVGLIMKADEKSASLSGGQQQRVALARALFNRPKFLVADEPTGSLDEKTAHSIIDLLLSCQHEWNMGLIVSSHDRYVAQAMEHVYQLSGGMLQEKKNTNPPILPLEETAAETLLERSE